VARNKVFDENGHGNVGKNALSSRGRVRLVGPAEICPRNLDTPRPSLQLPLHCQLHRCRRTSANSGFELRQHSLGVAPGKPIAISTGKDAVGNVALGGGKSAVLNTRTLNYPGVLNVFDRSHLVLPAKVEPLGAASTDAIKDKPTHDNNIVTSNRCARGRIIAEL
jgi:hypothetical protein